VLKITKEEQGYSAVVEKGGSNNSEVIELTVMSEDKLKKELYSLGIDQRDIETAFQKAAPEYFSVGRF
jgi:hypothetical protein